MSLFPNREPAHSKSGIPPEGIGRVVRPMAIDPMISAQLMPSIIRWYTVDNLDLDLKIMNSMRREDMVDREPEHRAAMVAKSPWTTSTPGASL